MEELEHRISKLEVQYEAVIAEVKIIRNKINSLSEKQKELEDQIRVLRKSI